MPSRYLSSADIDAMIDRTAPAIIELLADGVPRNRKGIVEALAGRHGKDDVVRTVMRMSVTGELDEVGRKFTLAADGTRDTTGQSRAEDAG